MSEGQGSEEIPKQARGEALETDDETSVPAQQAVGKENVEGGGEFPSPSTPPRGPAPGTAAPAPARQYTPQRVPLNMYEADGAIVLVAPLPGVMADDVEVIVDGRKVTITAAMRTSADKDYTLHEWHYGPFERTIEVPAGFYGEPSASFGNGQLALRIARADGPAREKMVVKPNSA
ncbi:MAG TPA: Hsp20/alpha crystallin family protein [Acidimicrobiales bacterium]|nr:Hsp20/alpha crystallin family protein [Acidimicrobiales bacterium]